MYSDRPSDPPSRTDERTLPRSGPLLAIDPGARRIGVAISDPDQRIAHPLGTLTRRTGRRFPLHQLRSFLDEHHPVGVVMGLPLEASGSEGTAAEAARAAGERIHTKADLPVAYFDERMSTARALRAKREMYGPQAPRRHPHDAADALAATTLLQTFLDRRR